jgi:hypothetical protein
MSSGRQLRTRTPSGGQPRAERQDLPFGNVTVFGNESGEDREFHKKELGLLEVETEAARLPCAAVTPEACAPRHRGVGLALSRAILTRFGARCGWRTLLRARNDAR